MSKKLKILLGGGIAFCILVISLTCGLYFGLKTDEHVHGTAWTYVQEENNKHTKKCNVDGCEGVLEDCDFVREVTTEAACTTAGVAKFTCACGRTYNEPITATGHQLTKHDADTATCLANGNTLYYECTVCEKYFSDESGTTEITDKTSVVISTADHNYGTLVAAKDATCSAKGNIAHYKCSVCNKYFDTDKKEITKAQTEIAINATAHNYGTLVAATPATCSAKGNIAYYQCSLCEKYFNESKTEITKAQTEIAINATAHNYGDPHDAQEETCTAPGNIKYYYCSLCDKYFNESKAEITQAQTVIPAGHKGTITYTYTNNDTHEGKCERAACPGIPGTCSYDVVEDNRESCDESGTGVKECKVCRHQENITLAAGQHSLGQVAEVAATATAHGHNAYYECSKCHSLFADANGETPTTAAEQATHYYGEWQEGQAATCMATGIVGHFQCPVCNVYFNAEHEKIDDINLSIDSTAHSFKTSYTIGTNGQKVFECERNSEHTEEVALSSIEITSAPEYVIKDGTNVSVAEFALCAVYEDDTRETIANTDAALTNNGASATAHTVSAIIFTYYGKTVTRRLAVYEKVLAGGASGTISGYQNDKYLNHDTTTGEFIYKFTLTNVTQPVAGETAAWDSWLLYFKDNNKATADNATLRADGFLLENFNRKADAIGTPSGQHGFTWTGGNDWPSTGTIEFTVSRTKNSDNRYQITVTMIRGGKTYTATIIEPADNSANMKFAFGGENCTYTYSDVIVYAAAPAQDGVRVGANNVSVQYGTALNNIKSYISVYQTFTNGSETRLNASDYNLVCEEYDSDTAGEYVVMVEHGDFNTTFTVKVLAEGVTPIDRLEYFTPQQENYQWKFASEKNTIDNCYLLDNEYIAFNVKPSYIDNPFKGQETSEITIHADVKVSSVDSLNWAPLFSVRKAVGNARGFMSIISKVDKWAFAYNDYAGTFGEFDIMNVNANSVLCLTIRMNSNGVTIFIDGVEKLSLAVETVMVEGEEKSMDLRNVKDFVLGSDVFYFFGGAWQEDSGSWSGTINAGFKNLGFYVGTMTDEQIKKLANDPETEDFTIVEADTNTDVTPLELTYPTQTISSGKYVRLDLENELDKSLWNYTNTHDPSIFKDPISGYYYAYSTDINCGTLQTGGIHIRKSLDLITWEYVNTAFRGNFPTAATSHVTTTNAFWAPDIIYMNGTYYLYYCLSELYTANSYMGVATSSSPEGPFVQDATHGGEIYKSTGNSSALPNAIDPNVVRDANEDLWCIYGSFFGGIYAIRLNNSTGLPLDGQGAGTRIAGGNGIAMEGPYVVMEGDYYYLFVSYGNLNSDYNVRVFRCPVSEGITGNYVDSEGYNAKVGAGGKAITTSDFRLHGNKILGGYKIGDNMGYRAPGHMSVLNDNGKFYMVSHTRTDALPSFCFFISIRQMFFTDDGWCVLNQNEYIGERLQEVNIANVMGTYDAVMTVTGTAMETYTNHEGGTVDNSNIADAHETLSKRMALNANGTVTGEHGTGTWVISDDYKITITIGSAVYSGFVIATKDLQGRNVISFTTINQNGVYLFGNCIQA